MKRGFPALLALALTACGVGNASDQTTVVIGYQSKTINTVTAGTLLRSLGYLEKRLGPKYRVVWQDYSTGAPITAQMVAGKIDIGSMGDYPMLINGSRNQQFGDGHTKLVAATGYNLRGALNMVVVGPKSSIHGLKDLAGKKISASVGSAGHGTTVHALDRAGVTGFRIQNQVPAVGASALQSGSVDALGQFVAWPGQLVFAGQARLLYDGAALNLPTWHGVVVRERYANDHPQVLEAFLRALTDATNYLNQNPMQAALSVAKETRLPPEVVYLYNGPNGMVTFGTALKPELRDALDQDIPFLASIGNIKRLDLNAFWDPSALQRTGPAGPPARITGTDPVCGIPVDDPAKAGEVWFVGETQTHPAANPTCLLRQIGDRKVRAAYVPSTDTGTRWFADKSIWVRDKEFLPFTTEDGAERYVSGHPGARIVSYSDALRGSR
ncbi:ABC transporter substrate-binding protein [Actinocrispum sp. NPDC049592]|uniref:ABC transporter substrate-binding protein n=1 Tax=Actinocrispum sp. NPDC049592 TaxID=3154835 RepID=UPI003435F446